jgi:hypothetical protein
MSTTYPTADDLYHKNIKSKVELTNIENKMYDSIRTAMIAARCLGLDFCCRVIDLRSNVVKCEAANSPEARKCLSKDSAEAYMLRVNAKKILADGVVKKTSKKKVQWLKQTLRSMVFMYDKVCSWDKAVKVVNLLSEKELVHKLLHYFQDGFWCSPELVAHLLADTDLRVEDVTVHPKEEYANFIPLCCNTTKFPPFVKSYIFRKQDFRNSGPFIATATRVIGEYNARKKQKLTTAVNTGLNAAVAPVLAVIESSASSSCSSISSAILNTNDTTDTSIVRDDEGGGLSEGTSISTQLVSVVGPSGRSTDLGIEEDDTTAGIEELTRTFVNNVHDSHHATKESNSSDSDGDSDSD